MDRFENSLFFNSFSENNYDERIKKLIKQIEKFIKENTTQVYLLDKILGIESKFTYDVKNVVYIAIPDYPILMVFNDDCSEKQIENYLDDLKEDLGQLSSKYNYNYILDRPRKWKNEWFKTIKWSEFNFEHFIENNKIQSIEDIRRVELLISLITGSINDINKIGKDLPKNLLDKVKQHIMLLDGKQSHFIYDKNGHDEILIQGMAGTGKTELLMRKIKELYVGEKNSRIAFTCFNKVLANEMKFRIEEFFNFMKVEEQIDWQKRLKVFRAWGSKNENDLGMYSYICKSYRIPFFNFNESQNFKNACVQAFNSLKEVDKLEPLFDYIFIDESQDFDESFFKLCKLVCKNTVYIAGDIFQSIFDDTKESDLEADYMLEKCYRTDPKTLMFAHSIGLGLFEYPPLNWLKDSEWEACGYKLIRDVGFRLTREPLRRFNDVQSVNSIVIEESKKDDILKTVLNNIIKLKQDNSTLTPNDLGIIIIDSNYNFVLDFSYKLENELISKLEWKSTVGFEKKRKEKNSVYISNENNVKGLEFPFIIVVLLRDIGNSIKLRNSLYMSLTRSFITSYLIINSDSVNKDFINKYKNVSVSIINDGYLELKEPTPEEIKKMKKKISMQKRIKVDINSKINALLNQKKYAHIAEEDKNFIMSKIFNEWNTLSEDEILRKTRQLIESIL